ncbi:MAG: exo-alpha-sialidase [Pedosphaera sp.]|nr:exo-alpha-sialidase [Pedosphaera sp.]
MQTKGTTEMERRNFLKCASLCGAGLLGLGTAALTAGNADGTNQKASPPLACDINSKIDPRDAPWTHLGWQKHGVVRFNGSEARQTLHAELYFIGGEWEYNNSQMPYLVYIPERKRLILAASVDKPATKATAVFSDDFGKTWTKPTRMHTNTVGNPDLGAATQLTYLGNGKLIIGSESRYWSSTDFGQTWTDYAPVPLGSEGKMMYPWDPMLVDKDPETGKVIRLVETRYKENGRFDTPEYFSQGCVRFSTGDGKTWSKEINVPQWKGANEIVLCRAKNGDMVAACRTDNSIQFLGLDNDQFSGLATSVSKDNGYTWSGPNPVYAWGRHHPHMITMPDGDIVMTYVVRNGYIADKNGLCRFGIEAVVSKDNGATWDLDHKYILASNNSTMKNGRENWGSPQSTSSVLLPDGSLLTAFGTGVRNVPAQTLWKMDVALVKWRPDSKPVDSQDTLRRAPYSSDLRNKFDLDSIP